MKVKGRRDVTITVTGGIGESGIVYADWIHNFATKCDGGAQYELEFRDLDDFGLWKEDNRRYKGPVSRGVVRKCTGFKIFLTNATDGIYQIRIGVTG